MSNMTTLDPDDIVGLAMSIRGRVVLPSNFREYQAEVERVHNSGLWDRKPLFFVLCHDEEDVRVALNFCTQRSLPISIRSGGHSASGSSLRDGTVVIDVSRMRNIAYVSRETHSNHEVIGDGAHVGLKDSTLTYCPLSSCCALLLICVSCCDVLQPIPSRRRQDPSTERVTMEPGCLLSDVNVHLLRHGRMAPVGVVPVTGVGGLCLHGGIGHLLHQCGLSVDNIMGLTLVLADGTIKSLDYTSTGDDADLFFATRGAAGSIGIVTSLTMRTYPMRTITGGVFMMVDDANYTSTRRLIRKARDMVLKQNESPDSRKLTGCIFMGNVPPDPSIATELHGSPATLAFCGAWGDDQDAKDMIGQFVDRDIVFGKPPAPMPFGVFNQLLTGMFLNFPPLANYFKGAMVHELPDDAFEKFCDLWSTHDPCFGGSMVGLEFYGGKSGAVKGAELTAGNDHCVSALRNFTFNCTAFLYYPNVPGIEAKGRELSRSLAKTFDDYQTAGYSNFLTELEGGSKDENLMITDIDRLRRVKSRVDPHGVFSLHVIPM
jgi:FAD/FMN-containing dehydrogenase